MRKDSKDHQSDALDRYPGVRALRAKNRLKTNYFIGDNQDSEIKHIQEKLSRYRQNRLKNWIHNKFDNLVDEAIDFFNRGEYVKDKA
ncbi:MAG: hypothetical protein K9G58_12055 [Bacteroidales bacterium]|nr:hypothetical protein [Bacteroidales bacterium]MCF8387482.1 hypothetical protein [Bacteroidales bacterium]MCF8398898.1 hypothetical protein [Bacteroidales bacterium]